MGWETIQINRNNWEAEDLETWRFYSSEENWEFSFRGKLEDGEEEAKKVFSNHFRTSYGIIQVSAWPS